MLAPRISAFCLLPFVLEELIYISPPSPSVVSKLDPFGRGLADFMFFGSSNQRVFLSFPHANAEPVWQKKRKRRKENMQKIVNDKVLQGICGKKRRFKQK